MGARIHLREKHLLAHPGFVLARSLRSVFEQPVHLLRWKRLKHLSLKHLSLQALKTDCWDQVHPLSF